MDRRAHVRAKLRLPAAPPEPDSDIVDVLAIQPEPNFPRERRRGALHEDISSTRLVLPYGLTEVADGMNVGIAGAIALECE